MFEWVVHLTYHDGFAPSRNDSLDDSSQNDIHYVNHNVDHDDDYNDDHDDNHNDNHHQIAKIMHLVEELNFYFDCFPFLACLHVSIPLSTAPMTGTQQQSCSNFFQVNYCQSIFSAGHSLTLLRLKAICSTTVHTKEVSP